MNDNYERCRALYRAARVHESSNQADRRAVRTALAAAVTTGAPAAAAAASAASVVSSSGYGAVAGASVTGAKAVLQVILGGKLLGAALVGTVLGTTLSATVYLARPAEQPVAAPAREERKTSAVQHSTAVAAQTVSSPEPEVNEPSPITTPEPRIQRGETRIGTEPRRGQMRPTTSARDKTPSDSREYGRDRLLQETQALAEVQSALSRKDANLAWTLLQEQERQFATGQLAQERAAAKVFALCVAGRTVDAVQERTRFLAAYPASPLSERVKKGCEQ